MTGGFTRRDATIGVLAATLAGPAFAQTPPTVPGTASRPVGGFQRLVAEGRYLPLWREVVTTPTPKGFNPQLASFVGEEGVALKGANGWRTADALSPDARAEDAVKAIVAASRGHRVVMLNEAHTASRHRAFLARVLRALRPEGFDILTVETLSNDRDPDRPALRGIERTGIFPPEVGYYTHDPVFADTVREAVALGYRLEAHEWGRDQVIRSDDRAAVRAARETAQAANLEAVLKANPGSRLLVYCGYDHLLKGPDGRGERWMASRFVENTGVTPLTVSQSQSGSFGPHGADLPQALAVIARFAPKAPVVVREGGVVVGAKLAGADLAVYHPSLPDIDGRPGWLAADPVRRRLVLRTPRRAKGEVVIVQAIHAHEPEIAVPADQHVLAKDERRAVLFLRPGRYRLRIESDSGFAALRTVRV